MKYSKMSLALVMSILFILQGCNGDEAAAPPPENVSEEQGEDQVTDYQVDPNDTGENDGGYMFDFTSFDLDVEYPGNKSYEVDFENDGDGLEAKVEDDLSNETYHGNDAFAVIFPVFEDLSINPSMAERDVITKVITFFNLSNDFTKFELEVEYSDGTKKEYHATNENT